MDDDFNTPQALAVLFDLAREINQAVDKGGNTDEARQTLWALDGVLGLTFEAPGEAPLDEELKQQIENLIEERAAARKDKNWTLADEIRHKLDEMGIILEDSPSGTTWKQKR